MADVSHSKTNGEIPAFAVEKLISPYMKSYLGPMKVVGADLKCVRRPDGTYRYTYTLTAEPAPGDKTSTTTMTPPPAPVVRSTSFTKAIDGMSIYSQKSAIFMKEVDFALFFVNVHGKEQRLDLTAEFETATTSLQQMIHQFRQEAAHSIGSLADFSPRLAIKIGKKSFPIDRELLKKTLKEILASQDEDIVSAGLRHVTIYADIRKS